MNGMRFFTSYRPQFYFRTSGVFRMTGTIALPAGPEIDIWKDLQTKTPREQWAGRLQWLSDILTTLATWHDKGLACGSVLLDNVSLITHRDGRVIAQLKTLPVAINCHHQGDPVDYQISDVRSWAHMAVNMLAGFGPQATSMHLPPPLRNLLVYCMDPLSRPLAREVLQRFLTTDHSFVGEGWNTPLGKLFQSALQSPEWLLAASLDCLRRYWSADVAYASFLAAGIGPDKKLWTPPCVIEGFVQECGGPLHYAAGLVVVIDNLLHSSARASTVSADQALVLWKSRRALLRYINATLERYRRDATCLAGSVGVMAPSFRILQNQLVPVGFLNLATTPEQRSAVLSQANRLLMADWNNETIYQNRVSSCMLCAATHAVKATLRRMMHFYSDPRLISLLNSHHIFTALFKSVYIPHAYTSMLQGSASPHFSQISEAELAELCQLQSPEGGSWALRITDVLGSEVCRNLGLEHKVLRTFEELKSSLANGYVPILARRPDGPLAYRPDEPIYHAVAVVDVVCHQEKLSIVALDSSCWDLPDFIPLERVMGSDRNTFLAHGHNRVEVYEVSMRQSLPEQQIMTVLLAAIGFHYTGTTYTQTT